MRRTRKNPINIAREKPIPQTPHILIPAQPTVTRTLIICILNQRRVRNTAIPRLAHGVISRLRGVGRAPGNPANIHHVRDAMPALAARSALAQDLRDVVAGGSHLVVWYLGGHGGGAGLDGARVHVVPAFAVAVQVRVAGDGALGRCGGRGRRGGGGGWGGGDGVGVFAAAGVEFAGFGHDVLLAALVAAGGVGEVGVGGSAVGVAGAVAAGPGEGDGVTSVR